MIVEKGYSHHTINYYLKDSLEFINYCITKHHLLNIEDINKDHVHLYFKDLYSRLSPSSINRHIASLKSFYRFLVKEGKIGYLKDIDRVVFIADRDPQNFKEEQYDEIVKQCVKAGYELYISNPTFELFLLMHDDRIFDLDRKQMIENRKISSKRFLETKVKEFFGHNKRHLVFDIYKYRIAIAIKNEKKFCEDLKELKSNLDSNVGLFLDSLMRH